MRSTDPTLGNRRRRTLPGATRGFNEAGDVDPTGAGAAAGLKKAEPPEYSTLRTPIR